MKRFAVVLALIASIALAVDVLGDLTQSRPDPRNSDADTELVFAVDENRFTGGADRAAAALWTVCGAQTTSSPVGNEHPRAIGEGRYRVVLHPAVGEGEERKLVGCLEDFTIERVRGGVVSFRAVPTSTAGQRS
jgi:hypothetical protein